MPPYLFKALHFLNHSYQQLTQTLSESLESPVRIQNTSWPITQRKTKKGTETGKDRWRG